MRTHQLALAGLLAIAALTALAVPGLAPGPEVLEQGHVLEARSALWQDAQGNEHTGLSGEGALVYNMEALYHHRDLQGCLSRAGAYGVKVNGLAVPPLLDTRLGFGHGTMTAGVLCGDGTMSLAHGEGPPITGVAPGMGLLTQSLCLEVDSSSVSSCDLFEQRDIRLVSDSTDNNPIAMAESMGAAPDANILFMNAAMNRGGDGSEAKTEPWTGSDDRLVTVAAANGDASDVASYSSRGAIDDPSTWPTITAPGCMFTTNSHPGRASASLVAGYSVDEECPNWDPIPSMVNTIVGYRHGAGTSNAAPYVAGVASLMLEVHPDLSAVDARHVLTRTADPFIPAEDRDGDGRVSPEEFRQEHGYKAGYGLVNATGAVAAAHYMALDPGASAQEAVDAFTVGRNSGGALVLNPHVT